MKTPTHLALWCLLPCALAIPTSGQEDTKKATLESVLTSAQKDIVGTWSIDQDATVAYIAKRPDAGLTPPPFTSQRVRELKLRFVKNGTMEVTGPNQRKNSSAGRFVLSVDENRNLYLIITEEFTPKAHAHDKDAVKERRKIVQLHRVQLEKNTLVTLYDGPTGTQCSVYVKAPSAFQEN